MAAREAPRAGGDVNYEIHGLGYVRQRRTDPRIAARIHEALGSAKTVLNVGAGAGSYEPEDRYVVAVEPSAAMRAQRPANLVPAIIGYAEHLPFDDLSFDASMATVTIHQWSDFAAGIKELRRVTRGPVVVLTFDGEALDRFWLADYAPELIAAERRRYPAMQDLCRLLGGRATVEAIQIPIDCLDGFTEAFYAKPDQFLDENVRRSQSAWTFVDPDSQIRIVDALRKDLETGAWEERYGHWRQKPTFEGSLRLVVGYPEELT
jgi:SAM-dependent methyltransferase